MKVILFQQLIRREEREKKDEKNPQKTQPLVSLQVDVSCCKSARTRWSRSCREIPHQPGHTSGLRLCRTAQAQGICT